MLNHPSNGNEMRQAVSEALKAQGKAQLTITADARGMWAFAISERPAEMSGLMSAFPIGSAGVVVVGGDEPTPAHH